MYFFLLYLFTLNHIYTLLQLHCKTNKWHPIN